MDARVRYTRSVIQETMLKMLHEMPIEKITVRELCTRAEINRATFYKHYDNPYDLLEKMCAERLDELESAILGEDIDNISVVFSLILEDIRAHFALYDLIFTTVGDDHFRTRLFDLCYKSNMKTIEEFFPDLDAQKKEWLYFFIADGCNCILRQWMVTGMNEPISEVVGYLTAIITCINKNLPAMI